MEKPKCPPGYVLYADPATGKDKCIKTSDFYKDLEKDMGGKKGINKIIYNRSPKGRTKLAKTGGLVKAKEGMSVKKGCPRGQCGTPPNCRECADNTRVSTSGPKKTIPSLPTKIQPKTTEKKLTKSELDALSHQKRGMGTSTTYVKKSGSVKNETGTLTSSQQKQLNEYMNKASTAKKVYEALPNMGRMFGISAADIPKGSQLEKQKKGGMVKPKKKK